MASRAGGTGPECQTITVFRQHEGPFHHCESLVCSLCHSQQGFGNIDGEYWLGLENIYWLTNQDNYKLLVTLEDWSGRKVFAEYASFRLEPEADFYKLRVGRYHGNAGDSLTWHNGKQFTTLDRDHDVYTGEDRRHVTSGLIMFGLLNRRR